MRVKFTSDFSFKPMPQVTIDYKAGREYTVKRACAEAAISQGKAVAAKNCRVRDQDGA